MPFVQNGVVVSDDRPMGISDYLLHIINLIVFFFTSIVSMEPQRQQLDTFNNTRRRNFGGSSGTSTQNTRLGRDDPAAGAGRRSNINTFGPAAQFGSCGTGGWG